MKRTYCVPIDRRFKTSGRDAITKMPEEMFEYFNSFYSHETIALRNGNWASTLSQLRGVATFYTSFVTSCPLPIKTVNVFQIEKPDTANCFSDWNYSAFEENVGNVEGFNVSKICWKEKVVGIYFRTYKCLIASDWVHTTEDINVIKEHLPLFAKIFIPLTGLQKVTPVPTKPDKVFNISLGCDPEFEIFDDCGDILEADEYIRSEYGSKIGVDGAGSQLELRPDPSESPTDVVKDIESILSEFSEEYEYEISTKGDNFSLGGHIHFGCPNGRLPHRDDFIGVLDGWLGSRLRELNGSVRREDGYGRLGDYRTNDWGFEYRTLPASIFLKPEMAHAVFTVCHKLANAFYNTLEGVDDEPTDEEWKRLGLENERKIIDAFKEEYPSISKQPMYMFWKIDKATIRKIIFRDEWHTDIMTLIEEQIKENLQDFEESARITLFGLHKMRGTMVYGFKSSLFPQAVDYAHPGFELDCPLHFGVPDMMRKGKCTKAEIKTVAKEISDTVMGKTEKPVPVFSKKSLDMFEKEGLTIAAEYKRVAVDVPVDSNIANVSGEDSVVEIPFRIYGTSSPTFMPDSYTFVEIDEEE